MVLRLVNMKSSGLAPQFSNSPAFRHSSSAGLLVSYSLVLELPAAISVIAV